jgi:hypothetical protein
MPNMTSIFGESFRQSGSQGDCSRRAEYGARSVAGVADRGCSDLVRGVHWRRIRTSTSRLRGAAVPVRDLVVPAPVRLAQAVAAASIVRDVAALAALVVLATMFSVLSGFEAIV